MTVFSPDSPTVEQGILLRELNHRINNELASAINLVSAAAVRAEGAEAKARLKRRGRAVAWICRCAAGARNAEGRGADRRRDIHPHAGLRHAPFLAGSNEYPAGTSPPSLFRSNRSDAGGSD